MHTNCADTPSISYLLLLFLLLLLLLKLLPLLVEGAVKKTAPAAVVATEGEDAVAVGKAVAVTVACALCEAVCFTEILDLYTFMMFLKLKVYMVLFCTISSINTIYMMEVYMYTLFVFRYRY